MPHEKSREWDLGIRAIKGIWQEKCPCADEFYQHRHNQTSYDDKRVGWKKENGSQN